jgi:hypothetical protein
MHLFNKSIKSPFEEIDIKNKKSKKINNDLLNENAKFMMTPKMEYYEYEMEKT